MTVCIDNAEHPLIIDSGEHCSKVARNYLDHHFPNWEKQLLPTKAKNFKSVSGKMTSIGTIIKELIIPHRKGNIRPNPELVLHQGESCINHWRLTSRCTARQDNVNRHMCHMRMSLKTQTHFNTIHNVRMRLRHFPPISVLATPHPFTPRPYHLYAHVVPSQHASDTASHPYACVVPSPHAPDTAYHPYARRVHS
ncbi:hypothetical protein O181_019643 [Austropuccinia psidii MF-1]|uniref:Uncharacterized protein n=1 Tax=Austropuccinia psidii MF-1 TaxID=1389203 RepID=A0A9Q3CA09_9BASI|nr:hypothetical protein [Austropuccinia psidii MF-1]